MNTRHGWRSFMIAASLLVTTLSAHAGDPGFCTRSKADLLNLFSQAGNRMGFQNDGGLGDGGVCWWHSRLQRSSIYLAQYAPEKPKPTEAAATEMVRALAFFSRVVEIPGYSNFSTFSIDYKTVIQKELNHWQLRDGFINQQWIRGISGNYTLPADVLHQHMDHIHAAFLNSQAGIWVMVQLKGIGSHALLVIGMEKTENGYTLSAIDSNYPDITRIFNYQIGDHSIDLGINGDHQLSEAFTPYLGFQRDFLRINTAIRHYCPTF